ncbi:alpha/beta fold hydrolase [Staphylospora marina]|uniref:alpha/beta fold hydrolase n=1 Tax=Staphylospora marina TaxID=2490858 RepID=UPI0019CF4C79|nr:alpha/beta hydrolase [Staphylospora marina]
MRWGRNIGILCLLLIAVWGSFPHERTVSTQLQPKERDLVLIHGYNNRHRWGIEFLDTLARHWGSGRIYLIYLNDSDRIWTRNIGGRTLICIGSGRAGAGSQSIHEQAQIAARKIAILQERGGLDDVYHVVAHSMGGLTARELAWIRPGEIEGLVTLGTPHQGTPLAEEFEWIGMFAGDSGALADIRPASAKRFNRKFPAEKTPLAPGGRIYTISGDADHWGDRGWHGEVAAGWTLLRLKYGKDSDGIVMEGDATLPGAVHVRRFDDLDHLELIQDSRVAETIAELLN